jgi:glycosyltransferase involved in cell wall biosynthesis
MPKDVRLEIIVPVYNGERELPAMLAALQDQVWREVRVTLVLNGCRDNSEAVARGSLAALESAGARTRLLHASHASRTAALNIGETNAQGHRLYLDQDAVLSNGALPRIVAALDAGFHFAGAAATWRTSSPLVGAAMRAWSNLPYVVEQPVTAGVYAISAAGRARWGVWPEGLPDDKFARLHFAPQERVRVVGVTYTGTAPDTFGGLVLARRRYLRSNRALRACTPQLMDRDGLRYAGLWRLAPALWPGALVLAAAEAGARLGRR